MRRISAVLAALVVGLGLLVTAAPTAAAEAVVEQERVRTQVVEACEKPGIALTSMFCVRANIEVSAPPVPKVNGRYLFQYSCQAEGYSTDPSGAPIYAEVFCGIDQDTQPPGGAANIGPATTVYTAIGGGPNRCTTLTVTARVLFAPANQYVTLPATTSKAACHPTSA